MMNYLMNDNGSFCIKPFLVVNLFSDFTYICVHLKMYANVSWSKLLVLDINSHEIIIIFFFLCLIQKLI